MQNESRAEQAQFQGFPIEAQGPFWAPLDPVFPFESIYLPFETSFFSILELNDLAFDKLLASLLETMNLSEVDQFIDLEWEALFNVPLDEGTSEVLALSHIGQIVQVTLGTMVLALDKPFDQLTTPISLTENGIPFEPQVEKITPKSSPDFVFFPEPASPQFPNLVVNVPPVAQVDFQSGFEGTDTMPSVPIVGNVLLNDTDVDSPANDFSVTTAGVFVGLYGTLTLNANGSFSYVIDDANPTVDGLNNGASLTENFHYTMSDNNATDPKTDTGILSITILGSTDGISLFTDGTSGDTLRAAVIAANAHPGEDTIYLLSGTYELTLPGAHEDHALTGDLDIWDNLIISGMGVDQTYIDANSLDRIFELFSGVSLTLRHLTLINGDATTGNGEGGAIWNGGTLILDNVKIEDSTAADGGALFNDLNATADIQNSIFTNNIATGDGGAFYLQKNSELTLTSSSVYDNEAGHDGGGAFLRNAATMTVISSTFSGNEAGDQGGGLFLKNNTEVLIQDSTISNNTTANEGGGISLTNNATGTLVGSIIAVNEANGSLNDREADLSDANNATFMSQGFNLIGIVNGADSLVLKPSDLFGEVNNTLDPLLGTLADNGGSTLTHALLPGSPAIDAGNPADTSVDQRGADVIGTHDIGSYEYDGIVPIEL